MRNAPSNSDGSDTHVGDGSSGAFPSYSGEKSARNAEAERSRLPICPDCPSTRAGLLEDLVTGDAGCAFRCVALGPRQPVPPRWPGSYGLALVRRGVIVRQRVDASGRATAIDAVGSGAGFLLSDGDPSATSAGYAASATLLCLLPMAQVENGLAREPETARDLWRLAQRALERVERLADARNRPTAEGRIGALLCALADTLTSRRRDVVPPLLQQRDLAVLVAVRHESVCRVLKKMGEDGLVRRDAEGIHLLDRTRLAALEAA